jgi:hypothetical protein
MERTSENVLDVIKKIADPRFQREVWIEGRYWDRVSDFDEAVNTLEDYNFFTDVGENKLGLPKKELAITVSFLDKLSNYDRTHDNFSLEDSRWQVIIGEAVKVYNLLLKYSW